MKRLFPLFITLLTCLAALIPAVSQEQAPAAAPAETADPVTDPARAYLDAAGSIDKDLRLALDELTKVRATIAAEKPAIAAGATQIAADLREKRRQSEIARISKDAAESEFQKTDNDLKVWRDERAYVESLLLDFRKSREVATGPLPGLASAAPDLASQLALVEEVLTELSRSGGPSTVKGEAVADDGVLTPGTFIKAGPVSWFLSDDGNSAGLVSDSDDLRPHLTGKGASKGDIEALVSGKADSITFDPTLGSAIALSESETTLAEHIKAGGFWIYPILLLAAVALAATLFKWAQLAKIREFGSAPVQRILDALQRSQPEIARSEATVIRHPARAILEQGIAFIDRSPHGSRDDLEEALYEKYLEASPALQRGLPFIAIAAAAAPLLGLLGTVTGMIETFRLINVFGTGDAKSLASGISEALITTEFGLIVAIPALILHALLSRKVQGIKATMEMTSLAFLNGTKTK